MFGSLKQYVFSGVSRHYKDETNRRIMVVNLLRQWVCLSHSCLAPGLLLTVNIPFPLRYLLPV